MESHSNGFFNFIGNLPKKTLALVALILIIAAVPLTVFVAQQQQDNRQHAGTIADYTSLLPPGWNCIPRAYCTYASLSSTCALIPASLFCAASVTPPPTFTPIPTPIVNPGCLLGIFCPKTSPTPAPTISPTPTCSPRPAACLDPTVACPFLPPTGGWCTPSPTPQPNPCSDGILSWRVQNLCPDGTTWNSGAYTCTNGISGTITNSTCVDSTVLYAAAKLKCAASPKTCPSSTPNPTISPSPIPTPIQYCGLTKICSPGYTCGQCTGAGSVTATSCICISGGSVTPTPPVTPTPIATVTPIPTAPPAGTTSLTFAVGLDALGNSGDHKNPDGANSNKNPTRINRTITVQIRQLDNKTVVESIPATMDYQISGPSNGYFMGTVTLNNTPTGDYRVNVKPQGYLGASFAPAIRITAGTNNQYTEVKPISLTAGDVNGDNVINILDYNIIFSCSIYSKDKGACNSAPQGSTENYSKNSDINDDGTVDYENDMQIFLREWSIQF